MVRLYLLPLLALAGLGPGIGCAVPEGDQTSPEGAHYRFLSARGGGDVGGLWELLHPDHRQAFERWHGAEKRAVQQVRVLYPPDARAAALAAMGGGRRADLEGPHTLFAETLDELAPGELSAMARAGARVKSVSVEAGVAVVRTWAGDEATYRQGPEPEETWYLGLDKDSAARLSEAAAAAEANLERVEANVAVIGGE